jgi:hypothetical protein
MLNFSLRKQIKEQKWLDIMNKDSNPTQKWIRLRNRANSAISDLKLLADRLPDSNQKDIFDYANITEFVIAMLRQRIWDDPNHDKYDARRTRLAAILAEESLTKCINQYKNRIETSEILNKQNVSLLEDAIKLCKEIAMRIQSLEETELKTKRRTS